MVTQRAKTCWWFSICFNSTLVQNYEVQLLWRGQVRASFGSWYIVFELTLYIFYNNLHSCMWLFYVYMIMIIVLYVMKAHLPFVQFKRRLDRALMGTAEMNTGYKKEKKVVISDLSKAVSYRTSIRGCLHRTLKMLLQCFFIRKDVNCCNSEILL